MNTFSLAMLNGWEILMILLIVVVLFGAKKLPELAKGLGQGIKEFKKASRDVNDEFQRSMEDDKAPAQKPDAKSTSAPSGSTPKAS